MKYVIIKMTKDMAYRLGLLVCQCGYPRSNHFDFGNKGCAHTSECKGYYEIARYGKLMQVKRKRRAKRKKK